MLFIVGGAFAGLEKIIESRAGKKGLGFGAAAAHGQGRAARAIGDVMPEDLLKFGLIPEFIGRLPVITTVSPLDRDALIRILTEPRNALVKQYQRMFEIDGVELEFTDDAIEAIADQALLRGTGARGLRAIMEEVLLPVMFDVPSDEDIARVVVTREVVLDNVLPDHRPPRGAGAAQAPACARSPPESLRVQRPPVRVPPEAADAGPPARRADRVDAVPWRLGRGRAGAAEPGHLRVGVTDGRPDAGRPRLRPVDRDGASPGRRRDRRPDRAGEVRRLRAPRA